MIHAYIGYRLVAVIHLRSINDCCCPEQSLHAVFFNGLLHAYSVALQTNAGRILAIACVEVMSSATFCHARPQQAVAARLKPL